MPVLDFHFLKLELKKQNWRSYIRSNNPVAAALLSKMGYQEQDQVKVKLEFLRMLVKMELDPARMTLLTGFFETYLSLSESEDKELEEEMGKMDDKEARKMIELTTSWEEKGREKGKIEGKIEGQAELLLKLLRTKFKDIPEEIEHKIKTLPAGQLEQLAEAIFDFKSLDDVRRFL